MLQRLWGQLGKENSEALMEIMLQYLITETKLLLVLQVAVY